mmetsp:Transcript_20581/g.57100  ORF Transcript_20581/g.57100 Transcript_20581/m.57100 type:complete len:222 (+) Transcript_20581:275-940(+)
MEAFAKLKVSELKEELKNRGLVATGTKQVLLERLQEHLESAGAGEAQAEAAAPATDAAAVEPAAAATNGAEKKVAALAEAPAVETEKVGESEVEEAKTDGDAAMSEVDKKLLRAQRFGMVTKETVEEKKKQRAERFGIPLPEDQKRLERAKRFGLPLGSEEKKKPALDKPLKAGSKAAEKSEAAKKLEERAKRFGTGNGTNTPDSGGFLAKKKARAERFKE